MRLPITLGILTILLAACGQPANQQASSPAPSPTGAPSAAPAVATPVPATPSGVLPAATPPPATVAPGATLVPGTKVAPAVAENAAPQIVDLHLDKTVVQSGDVVSGTVRTSLNTASVEARIGGYGISVPKVGAGRFALRYTVPNLPFFLKRTYDMVVIARNTAGVKTMRTVPITIR